MTERPLADSQRRILLTLLEHGAMTPNALGLKLKVPRGRRQRGPWSGPTGPAQRLIPAITGLRRRGLTSPSRNARGDYPEDLTADGRMAAIKLREESKVDKPNLDEHVDDVGRKVEEHNGRKFGERVEVGDDVDDAMGPFLGEQGWLIMQTVGAAKYGNERVWTGVLVDGTEMPVEAPLEVLDNIDPD